MTDDKKIKLDVSDPEIKATWEAALAAREEVASWPAWKRGSAVPEQGPKRWIPGAYCSICGAPQWCCESGTTCDNGHGGADSIGVAEAAAIRARHG